MDRLQAIMKDQINSLRDRVNSKYEHIRLEMENMLLLTKSSLRNEIESFESAKWSIPPN
eukprot:CAMPEP_0204893910 /NCGR_PEP_ID=MMETSP1349-20130617/32564_1 /ASSEMBLY_ACC=CAM_ASM_000710 /TAXON_ID=215587 /ORGANISM="Aplanochytrium stocchinoi, Strain GSBS06" /LENGTH=58 /DNA_ID=CAMNT_0052060823 /DNA_START=164 /DNA_END=337 /DNA_ORIENTATION=+